MSAPQFAVLVPVKPPALGKSRLAGLPDEQRRDLATAFALDTVTAALACHRVSAVLAVTDDHLFAARLAEAGCAVVPDGVAGNLNASLQQAAAEAHRRWPTLTPVALCADLPALRSSDLDRALAETPEDRPSFVADTEGVGTTFYCAPYPLFSPRFGTDSRAAHLASGATELTGELTSLRRDVDDAGDLGRALVLGVGPFTAAVAGRH